MKAGDTITVRGEGGAVSQIDVPPDGTVQRELLDDLIRTGKYVVLHGPSPDVDEPSTVDEVPASTGEPGDDGAVPDGTIDEVAAWVRGSLDDEPPAEGWDVRARMALDVELARGDAARKTLVALLRSVLGDDEVG